MEKVTQKNILDISDFSVKNWGNQMYLNLENGKVYMYLENVEVVNIYTLRDIYEYIFKNNLVNITKENIHLYYEFMNDYIIEKNLNIISDTLKTRSVFIFEHLFGSSFIDASDISDFAKSNVYSEGSYHVDSSIFSYCSFYSITYFGIKDTLKPIDEYIEEIKESEAHKSYIAENA